MSSFTKYPVIGYSNGHGVDFVCWCTECSKSDPVIIEESEPIFVSSIGDFEGSWPHCRDCGEQLGDDESELTERRREYHNDIRADFRRLGLR